MQVSQQPPGEGLSVGEALIAAGARIRPEQALGGNRDRAMITAHEMKAAPWLESLGWEKRGGKWYQMEG